MNTRQPISDLEKELAEAKQEIEKWNKLKEIAPPEKWIKVYEHYSDRLTKEDVAGWWQEQFNIANTERNELKAQIKLLQEEKDELLKSLEEIKSKIKNI